MEKHITGSHKVLKMMAGRFLTKENALVRILVLTRNVSKNFLKFMIGQMENCYVVKHMLKKML